MLSSIQHIQGRRRIRKDGLQLFIDDCLNVFGTIRFFFQEFLNNGGHWPTGTIKPMLKEIQQLPLYPHMNMYNRTIKMNHVENILMDKQVP